jgi:hypothetical protein
MAVAGGHAELEGGLSHGANARLIALQVSGPVFDVSGKAFCQWLGRRLRKAFDGGSHVTTSIGSSRAESCSMTCSVGRCA